MSPKSDSAVATAFQDAEREEVRDLAREHTTDAIKTLVRLMKAPKTPPGVKRQCAMDILSQGWGRPDSRSDSGGMTAKAQGITVNILKLSTNTVEQIKTGDEDVIDVSAVLDMANMLAAETEEKG